MRLPADDLPDSERNRLREALPACCARDTEAMIGVYNALSVESDTSARDWLKHRFNHTGKEVISWFWA